MFRVIDAILPIQNDIRYGPRILNTFEKFTKRLAGYNLGKSCSRGSFRVEI